MRFVITSPEVTFSTSKQMELHGERLTLVTSRGAGYHIRQNATDGLTLTTNQGKSLCRISQGADGTLQIELHNGELLGGSDPGTPQTAQAPSGPRIVKGPKPRQVQCATCDSTIEYVPGDLIHAQSWGDDPGPLAVKCPNPGCKGLGFPR